MSLQEVEQEPFDPDEYVERLAWRTMGGIHRSTKEEDFDPMVLHGAFEQTIKELKDMNIRMQMKVETLEAECKEEEKRHWARVAELRQSNQAAFNEFRELDERINFVATKVVHVGDQLEGVNTPRARAVEAQMLINYFQEFLDGQPRSDIFTDPFQLQLAADVIQKLYQIAQELPPNEKFDKGRQRINDKYKEIEDGLIYEFKHAHHDGDKRKMKRIASVLANFKGYHDCINAFIEESQKGAFKKDVFEDIPPLCEKTNSLINEVFINPDMVMSKMVLHLYHGKLQGYIVTQLSGKGDMEKYLQTVFQLYTRTCTLSRQLSVYNLGGDTTFLNKVTKSIFQKYLDTYILDETRFLRGKCSAILSRYYESKNHQKRQIQSGGIHEFRRDLQAVIGQKANLNLGPTIENYGGETFLSQEVAINLLQEFKLAYKRCQVLSNRTDLSSNATSLFEVLVQHLCIEHIDYALELGLQAIPLSDPKTEPEIYFFDVVGHSNTVFHLFEKQFSDSLVPLISGTAKYTECLQKKREVMESMENKMDLGLDRTISAMIGWIKRILATEQKPSDFKPDSEEGPLQMMSTACAKVVSYINTQMDPVKFGLDGKNFDAVVTEFGMRFHRVIFEHLQQYQYNSLGAMLAICDVNEYRKCVKDFAIPLVTQLFDTLHSLCNLLAVMPDNLRQACTGEQLAGLDKSTMLAFVQLRCDYKTGRLANHFK